MIGVVDASGSGLVHAALEHSGHPVLALESAEAAVAASTAGRLQALVVETVECDDAIRALLERAGARLPVLVVSRDRSISGAVDALRAGATDFMNAPFELASLLPAVERLLDVPGPGLHAADASGFLTNDPELRETLELARQVAASDATVLIEGESGTGKELLARLVHECSPRRDRELVSVNCAALPAGLLESELFGHERGAFTGAFARVLGKFELAQGATILLDEIGELEIGLQAKLLRVIQEKQVQRVGAPRPIAVDFRLIATTNRNLAREVRGGTFREDLFYRLNVLPLRIKPLRERCDDVPMLVSHFLRVYARAGAPPPILPPETMAAMQARTWAGNVRELENQIERLTLTHPGRVVEPGDVDTSPTGERAAAPRDAAAGDASRVAGDSTHDGVPPFRTIREMERWLIVATLRRLAGNRTRAAQDLGISLRTLRNKINDYRIDEPDTLPQSQRRTRERERVGSA